MQRFVAGRFEARFVTLVTLVTALAVVVAGILLPAAAIGSGPVVRAAPECSQRPQHEAPSEEPAEDHEQDDERGLQAVLPGGAPAFVPVVAIGSAIAVARCRVPSAGHRGAAPIRGPPRATAIRD